MNTPHIVTQKGTGHQYLEGRVVICTSKGALDPYVLYQDASPPGATYVMPLREYEASFDAPDHSAAQLLSRQGEEISQSLLFPLIKGLVALFDSLATTLDPHDEDNVLADFDLSPLVNMEKAGFFRSYLLKLQRPIAGYGVDCSQVLAYDKTRDFCTHLTLDDSALELFGEAFKIYVKSRLWADGTVQLISVIEDQPW